MSGSIKTLLQTHGVLRHVILPMEIDTLLSLLEPVANPTDMGDGIFIGDVAITNALSQSPLPGFDLALALPTGVVDPVPFKLKIEPTSFKFWLVLARQGQACVAFRLLDRLPGFALTGAFRHVDEDGDVSLQALPAEDPRQRPRLVCRSPETGAELGPALLVSGAAGSPATLRFTPDTDSTEGVVSMGFDPPEVLFGNSGIGFSCPTLVLDDSEHAIPPGTLPAGTKGPEEAPWRGLLAREVEFFLPARLPVFGGQPIQGFFAIPFAGPARMVVEAEVPARTSGPGQRSRLGHRVRIECMDPTASGFGALVPTLLSASLDLPLDDRPHSFNQHSLTFASGKPVRVTATLARDPVNAAGDFRVVLAVSAQGPQGIASVTSTDSGPAKFFNTAAALATTLIADQDLARDAEVGDTQGVVLSVLAGAGAALSALFEDESQFVLHGVELESSGHGAPVGGPMVLTLDYSVAVRVVGVNLTGGLGVEMRKDQPMRIRIRGARLALDPDQTGLAMVGLDFDKAQMEVEDPGAWNIGALNQLFDVIGSRSGRGSSWIEVDLRFKLNLGPVEVSGTTIRVTLEDSGTASASIRGMQAGLSIPGVIEGRGGLQLIEGEGGFEANLMAKVMPLNLSFSAGLAYADPRVLLDLALDLPAPIPLGTSGLGVFGIAGGLGLNAVPTLAALPGDDTIAKEFDWPPKELNKAFAASPPNTTLRFGAVVATLPDLGFSFSAKAGLTLTVPDAAVRASLDGRVLQPPVKVTDRAQPPGGLTFRGFLNADKHALTIGLLGKLELSPLLTVRVPMSARFPFGAEAHKWHLYLGDDGRSQGPISARVLPTTLDVGADAYVMFLGNGITNWPHNRPEQSKITLNGGFVAAFGFGVQTVFGVPPIAWANLYASLDLLVGTSPPTLAGFGRAGGSLHLGPFSVGVASRINLLSQQDVDYFWAEVTARVELLFFDLEATITLEFGDTPTLQLPLPDRHPLERVDDKGQPAGTLACLTDDSYRVLAPLHADPAAASETRYHVWPDAMVSLPFAFPLRVASTATSQFAAASGGLPVPQRLGGEMLWHEWSLDGIQLVDVTEEVDPFQGAGVLPSGQLSCRWQAPRGGDPGGDVRELVLFSTSNHLWLNRMADAGKSLPHDPLKAAANICHFELSEEPGWALGWLAEPALRGYRLPPERINLSRTVSRVDAVMRHFATRPDQSVQALDGHPRLSDRHCLRAAELQRRPGTKVAEHEFEGYLQAPSLCWLGGAAESSPFADQKFELDPTEPILEGVLVMVGDRALFEHAERSRNVVVIDQDGDSWPPMGPPLALPDGDVAAVFHDPKRDTATTRLVVHYPLAAQLGIFGLRGVTASARAAVQEQRLQIAEERARLFQAFTEGPKVDNDENVAHQRVILQPGRLYRLDLDFSWTGALSKQDEAGQIVPQAPGSGTDFLPKGAGQEIPARRQLFFHTASKADQGSPGHQKGLREWLYLKQDAFHPEMIQRYLSGYEPAQSELFRFCDDPLRVHFSQDHVAALADAYGFELELAVRRVDAPGTEHENPTPLSLAWTYGLDVEHLVPTDQVFLVHALASSCKVPTPGLSGTALTPLAPEAWYTLYLRAMSTQFANASLPGVTFRTSRWRSAEAMLAGLGFAVPGQDTASVLVGDLHVSLQTAAALPLATSDQGFVDLLAALGCDDWPICEAPRLSRLWTGDADEGWKFAGLMIESPEPIHRPGRIEATRTVLQMGNAGAGIQFGGFHRDRSGSRLLVLAQQPFAVVTRERVHGPGPRPGIPGHWVFRTVTPTLAIEAVSTPDRNPSNFLASLLLPARPGFAEEP